MKKDKRIRGKKHNMSLFARGDASYVIQHIPEHNVTVARMFRGLSIEEMALRHDRFTQEMICLLGKYEGDIIPVNIKSVALCQEEDNYDALTGTQISACKAEIKYREKIKKLLSAYTRKLNQVICKIEEMAMQNEKRLEACQKEYQYRINHIPE